MMGFWQFAIKEPLIALMMVSVVAYATQQAIGHIADALSQRAQNKHGEE